MTLLHCSELPAVCQTDLSDNEALFFADIRQVSLLTIDEERDLTQRARAGDQAARDWLIAANLRLVASIAYRYKNFGVDWLDLMQEGAIGLLRAVDKYDPASGNRLGTYATYWIRQAISRAVDMKADLIRKPVHTVTETRKLRRANAELSATFERPPTDDELIETLGWSRRQFDRVRSAPEISASLDAPVASNADSDTAFGDLLADTPDSDPEQVGIQTVLTELLLNAVGRLTEYEQELLQLRYGLKDGQARTLNEVGALFGVSREMIRIREKAAIKKLREDSALQAWEK